MWCERVIVLVYIYMRRRDSFVEDFQIVNIAVISNVDDDLIKSISPPKVSLLDYFCVKPSEAKKKLKCF